MIIVFLLYLHFLVRLWRKKIGQYLLDQKNLARRVGQAVVESEDEY